MIHIHPLRVYYEDTDMAGVVYYANYLKFTERGRSEAVRALGVSQTDMKAGGVVFVVHRFEADYLLPALYDDELVVETRITGLAGASMEMTQRVLRGDTLLFASVAKIACMTLGGRPTRIPAEIRQKLGG